ncbi:SRPBCC family protein [Allokutzneria sp. A3M-2-11 16]|uniref:SRPBCC family protein n=1 Tax=Allokutzneria sp. A3M-2-11 16 TaxID=2962043 RepID=UPI0020B8EEE2|nr:SRPBCC family protein [Allokutzneria sp. A3M-2-11 16]MCP3802499.1 SRPBCC family protein [Allokutzneria sp. A3M-2-11 16]
MIKHATFTLERDFPAPPAKVFALWADPESKAKWFAGPGAEHELDFREGGTEIASGVHDGTKLTFEAVYREIVADERIVCSGVLRAGDTVATVSQTTVQFEASGGGTHLLVTEQGAYLDGHEEPEWRQRGIETQLAALEKLIAER